MHMAFGLKTSLMKLMTMICHAMHKGNDQFGHSNMYGNVFHKIQVPTTNHHTTHFYPVVV